MTNQIAASFTADALDRKVFAEGVYKLLQKRRSGVVALDGDWGVGKTWFGVNLKRLIEEKNEFNAVWIDAFEADWVDDPALTLISSIGSTLPEDEKKNLFDTVAPLASKALPIFTKIAFKATGNFFGINEDLIDEAGDLIKDQSSEFIRKKLDELAERKDTLLKLKESISCHIKAAKGEKVIIFVDELDRCSPAYAIRLLERLKHLFDIDGAIFILLWNRQQIRQAVEAFYGAGTNGAMYLDKFIDYPLSLSLTNSRSSQPAMGRLIEKIGQEMDASDRSRFHSNASWLTTVADLLHLNARQSQRISNWWVMSATRNFVALETWLIGIKAKYPEIYNGIRANDKEAHGRAADLLKNLENGHQGHPISQVLIRFHEGYESGNFDENNQELIKFCTSFGVPLSNVIGVALRHIDETFD